MGFVSKLVNATASPSLCDAMASITEAQFWQAIGILIRNYHALNKRIFEVVITQVEKQKDGRLCESSEEELVKTLQDRPSKRTCSGFKIGFKLLPKKLPENILGTGTIDFAKCLYECQFASDKLEDFSARLQEGQLLLESEQNSNWLQYVVKHKLLNWSQSKQDEKKDRSMRLVSLEQYNDLYKELKRKHSQHLIDLWKTAQESTDPLKFIYEDLAIAAYLICVWRSTTPDAFADLGCGNGLLVHVLNAEGFKGYGYDVRKRKLWSLYPADTQQCLFEKTVEPNNFRLDFPEINWLIGNHSDELSAWIPVIAGRLNLSYFLLPCCPYELSGAKFRRRNTKISAYQDFCKYIKLVSEKCGFPLVIQDRLKIPSTKRLGLIGIKRRPTIPIEDLEYFVQEELRKYRTGESEVKLREKEERVRNCTQVDKSIIDALVLKIFNQLLAANEDKWSGRLPMREIAQSLTKEELSGIKSECGGIKTLLRNKHEVFEFCGGDLIGIRTPKPMDQRLRARVTTKKRSCFFKQHHPLGCPLEDAVCSFIH
ncbi:probable tRNA (uracil-O(2)-)-methyltransferase [Drosophila biarmipes]|uniref:probable tRNA (uracil-O(2)-)-methyltransferase n=1 Tax=Drosophila biarmipes TaxID=125945 RepID=UPI0021CCFAE2|nr:probable tRNA (uracil-O(2)-)-methyltransferase [Drosophila biarmipes]